MYANNLWFLWEIVVNIIENSLIFYFLNKALGLEKRNQKKAVIGLVIVIVIISVCNYFNSYLNVSLIGSFSLTISKVIVITSIVIFAILCFKGSFSKKLFIGIVPAIVSFIADLFTGMLASTIADLDMRTALALGEVRFALTISYLIITAIIFVILSNINFSKKKSKIFYPAYLRIILIACLLIGLVGVEQLIGISFVVATDYNTIIEKIIIANIAFLSVLIITFILFEKTGKIFKINIAYAIEVQRAMHEKELLSNYETSIQRLREAKHDMKGHLDLMQALLNDDEIDKLKEYFAKYNENYTKSLDVVLTKYPILNALLTNKLMNAHAHNICFNYKTYPNLKLPQDQMEVCAVFNNLIDNAIEACEKISDKNLRYIELTIKNKNSMLILNIENSSDGIYNLSQNNLMTSKSGEGHGIGLNRVRHIAEKYGGYVNIIHEPHRFVVEVFFPLK